MLLLKMKMRRAEQRGAVLQGSVVLAGLGHQDWPGLLGSGVPEALGQGCAGNTLCSLQPQFSLQAHTASPA